MKAPTPVTAFTETAVLYALVQGDGDKARQLLEDMLDNELITYYWQISKLIDLINQERYGRRLNKGTTDAGT